MAQYTLRARQSAEAVPPYLANAPPTVISKLENKMRVASEYRPGELATLGLWIDSGSVYEDAKNNGVAHFMEHLIFKGTPSRTTAQLEREIENMGGKLDAYTARDSTAFFAQVLRKDAGKAVEILADVLQNSQMTAESVEGERHVILKEMDFVERQPMEALFDHLHATAYQGSSLGYAILGPAENVNRLNRDDIVGYAKKHFTAPRMNFVAVGNVEHAALARDVEKHFGKMSGEVGVDHSNRPPTEYVGSSVLVRDDSIPMVHAAVALESVPVTHPEFFTFQVMQSIVGNWDRAAGGGRNVSSRLGELLAEEGLAHSLMSFNLNYHDTGLFGAYLVAEKEKVTDAIYELMYEWARLGQSVTEFEVELAKNKLKSQVLAQLNGSRAVADGIGRQLVTLGRRMTPYEQLLRIDEVTVAEVQRVAKNRLYDTDPVAAALGTVDLGHFPDYNILREWTFLRRQ